MGSLLNLMWSNNLPINIEIMTRYSQNLLERINTGRSIDYKIYSKYTNQLVS